MWPCLWPCLAQQTRLELRLSEPSFVGMGLGNPFLTSHVPLNFAAGGGGGDGARGGFVNVFEVHHQRVRPLDQRSINCQAARKSQSLDIAGGDC